VRKIAAHRAAFLSVIALGELAPPELLALQDRLLDLTEVHATARASSGS